MKILTMLFLMMSILVACNLKEGIKETGDAVQEGAQNAVEALKQAPAEISEASNKAEAEMRK